MATNELNEPELLNKSAPNFEAVTLSNKNGVVKDYFGGYLATHTGDEEVRSIDHLTMKIDKILADFCEN